MINALTLWAPGLLNQLRVKEAQQVLKNLKLPALQSLISKADQFPAKQESLYKQASYLFHQSEKLPVAATQASIELPEFDDSLFWVKVDPVQMIPDRDSLVLVSGKHLAISKQESKALLEAFNQHFREDGVELIWGDTYSWHLSIKQPVDIYTHDIELVDGKPINQFLPEGNAASYWRQLINETQMLFFSHPVNEQRREQGWPEINSVWVWGEGSLQSNQLNLRPDTKIWSDNTYLQGMAGLTNSQQQATPSNLKDFLESQKSSQDNGLINHFILLDEVYENIDNLQIEEWESLLKSLEAKWFAPLLKELKAGRIQSLFIDLGCDYRCHLKPGHMRRFWRFRKGLDKV